MHFWLDFASFALKTFWLAGLVAAALVVPALIGARARAVVRKKTSA